MASALNRIMKLNELLSYGARLSTESLTKEFHTSSYLAKHRTAGRVRAVRGKPTPITYEECHKPDMIGVCKNFNSWNTSNLQDGLRKNETLVEDMLIRRIVNSTWHRFFISELIIKRRANLIIICGIFLRSSKSEKFSFLQGYTEELLSILLKCPVKMELQSTNDPKQTHIKTI